PAVIRQLVMRCLEKDPKRRLRDVGDIPSELGEDGVPRPTPVHGHVLAWTVAAVLLIAVGLGSWSLVRFDRSEAVEPIARTSISLPANFGLAAADTYYPLAVSPDGRRVAYVAQREGQTALYVRELSSLAAEPVQGTSGAKHPFFSPDGQWIGFFAAGALQKVALDGGTPLRICNV